MYYHADMTSVSAEAFNALVVERDFLMCLVELAGSDAPEVLSAKALRLIVERAGAERGYLQLGDADDPNAASWVSTQGFASASIRSARSDADPAEDRPRGAPPDDVRALLSTTIMREALSAGHVIETTSATSDPRFRARTSVQMNRIEAVLCLPIGRPAVGILYLQSHTSGHRFPPEALAWAERFALHLAPLAKRMLDSNGPDGDPTASTRAQLAGCDAIVGRSPALATVLRWAAAVASRDTSAVITGASGSGKSMLASIIAASSRDTVVIDDVDRLALDAQAALVVDPRRLVATTSVRLDAAVQAGRFDAGLWRRLSAATFAMPGLAERRGDVPRIAERFLIAACARLELPAMTLSPTAQQALLVSPWPGELHQLASTMSAAALRASADQAATVGPSHLFADAPEGLGTRPLVAWHIAIRDCQRRVLKDALEATHGNITEAARRLGIARSYAYELVRDLNLR